MCALLKMASIDQQTFCVFCRRSDVSHEAVAVGEKLQKDNLTVHENCLYFSSGLSQKGESDDGEENSIRGFLLRDIQREVRRGTLFRCVVCKQAGASVGCSIKSCRNVGHVPCLQTKNYLFQYFGCFATFCPKHRPNQKALLMMNESISTECCICLSAIQLDDDFRKLFCPSCLTPFHRECIQKQARTAGKYFFKCPVCNNKDSYVEEMLRMGISVPVRDAEWESSGQFREDLEESKYCNAVCCLCPQGRSHYTQLGRYRMKKCQSCGQWLGHIHCVRKAQHLCSDCVLVQPPASLNPSLPRTVSTLTVYTQNTTNRSSVSTTTLDVQRLPMKQDCSCVVCEARACSDDDEKEEFGKGEYGNTLSITTYSSPSHVFQTEPTLRVSIPRCVVSLGQEQSHTSLIVSIPQPISHTLLPTTVHPKMIELLQSCPHFTKVATSVKIKRLEVCHTRNLHRLKSYQTSTLC